MINRSHCYSHQSNQPIYAYTLHAGATVVRVSNYGATLLSIETPDVHGDYDDIVLGFDAIDAYASDPGVCFGATVGPVANRTAHGEVPLGETVFRMTLNDHGCNNLHTDLDHGLHKRMWSQKEFSQKPHESARLVLQCSLADNELGLPGNRRISALFELDQAGTLTITYRMETDAPTYANITNHTYFNLAGTSSVSVLTEMVALEADEFVVIDKNSIPTGELRSVVGTPFDFRTLHPLGAQIEAPDEQLSFAHGYDHCFCVRNPGQKDYTSRGSHAGLVQDEKSATSSLRPALHAYDSNSGRHMEVLTTTPGIQLYTANGLEIDVGKQGAHYGPHTGFAVEPQFYPDCIHHPLWPQPVCTPEHPFCVTMQYRFSRDE